MHVAALIFCAKCQITTTHTFQSRYDATGTFTGSVYRCKVCLSDHAEGEQGAHEAPAGDPPPAASVLTETEIKRAGFVRHLYRTGRLHEWPQDWWETALRPGVWG